MSADRFQFLEFEEEGAIERPEFGRGTGAGPGSSGREFQAELLADGTTLAQVRVLDPRGYAVDEDEEEGLVTLSSLAGQMGARPTRLRAVEVFGERGDKAGQFRYPTGLAVDGSGILFVADSFHHRVQRITPGGGVAVIGSRGSGRGQFQSPQGIAVDSEDSFYVLEQGGGRVQKFTREGVLVLTFGRPGRGEGEMHKPTAIAVAPSGHIYVADTGNSRVQCFDGAGRFVSFLGGATSYETGINSPQALAAEAGGSLYVADTFGQRVQRFDPLGRMDRQLGGRPKGQALRRPAVSSAASPPLDFYQPRSLAVDPAALLYIADSGEPDALTGETRGRVQCLSLPEFRLVATIEKVGRSLGTLVRPGGLAVNPIADGGRHGNRVRGDLYVADTMNHRILRFAWSGPERV